MTARITLSRNKGWRKPEGALIVSRPSIWGNPWSPGAPGQMQATLDGTTAVYLLHVDMTQLEAVQAYRAWITDNTVAHSHRPPNLSDNGKAAMKDHLYARRKVILSNLHSIIGKDLACWCKPDLPCHADVLMDLAAREAR